MQATLFDLMTDKEQEIFKPKVSTEWDWEFGDYPQSNGLKVFSCFACGGGSTMGYKLAGCNVIGCCEIDEEMNQIYVKNHNPKYNYLMDIREFNKLEDLPEELYNLDILDGSPPCTTFSITGKREETWGKEKVFREGQVKQTLDDLSFVFIETVKKLQPKVVVMENVEGLLLGEAWDYVKRIYSDFDNAGYRLHHWLLKGETMGVPQTRHRVFFAGIRKDLNIDPREIDMTFNYKPITYGEIKSGTGDTLNKETVAYYWLTKATPEDKRLSDTIIRLGEKEKLFNHRICWEHRPMQTVTSAGEIYRGTERTHVSVEDVIRASTFPADYNFSPNTRRATTLRRVKYVCGMSVPPLMIKRITERIIGSGVFIGGTE